MIPRTTIFDGEQARGWRDAARTGVMTGR